MRFDRWTYAIGAAAVAVLLGALAGAGPGVLAALAGLGSAALWEAASDHRKGVRASRDLLADAQRTLAPPELSHGGPARYLRPEAAVVSFWPRPELTALRAWLVSPRPVDIALVTRESGAGKTRLALQLGHDAEGQYGWQLVTASVMAARDGRREEALGAISGADSTYRELAAAGPDALLPDLAMALNNQSGVAEQPVRPPV